MPDLRPVPPSPAAADRGARRALLVVHAGLAAIWAVLHLRVIPAFGGMFADFGAVLPGLTELLLAPAWVPAWATLGLAGPLALLRLRDRRGLVVLLFTAVLSGLGILITGVGLYLPILAVAEKLGP